MCESCSSGSDLERQIAYLENLVKRRAESENANDSVTAKARETLESLYRQKEEGREGAPIASA